MEIKDIIAALGGSTVAAQKLGIKRTTIIMWRKRGRLPPQHVPAVARAIGIPADQIWPALSDPVPQDTAA